MILLLIRTSSWNDLVLVFGRRSFVMAWLATAVAGLEQEARDLLPWGMKILNAVLDGVMEGPPTETTVGGIQIASRNGLKEAQRRAGRPLKPCSAEPLPDVLPLFEKSAAELKADNLAKEGELLQKQAVSAERKRNAADAPAIRKQLKQDKAKGKEKEQAAKTKGGKAKLKIEDCSDVGVVENTAVLDGVVEVRLTLKGTFKPASKPRRTSML